eukprot:TRINITY_DN10672_c0_g1_i1.p1 TRINITY_DN10672_c0_g1~~TRINITY_DN10672_c0_g1_i1.p1  ORF type:complete len:257 (+),score=57.78 TRINITY_DN10672_c0_g1_i1:161-931(+)
MDKRSLVSNAAPEPVDDDFTRRIREATSDRIVHMSDEEYARQLQEELNEEPVARPLSPRPAERQTFYYPQTPTGTASAAAGTYAAPPPGGSFGSASQSAGYGVAPGHSPFIDSPQVLMPSAQSQAITDTRRRAMMIKVFCGIDWFFALYALVVGEPAWWLSGGLIFAPIGFYGAHRYYQRWMMVHLGYAVVQMLLRIIWAFLPQATSTTDQVIVSLISLSFQAYLLYIDWGFFQRLRRGQHLADGQEIALETISTH